MLPNSPLEAIFFITSELILVDAATAIPPGIPPGAVEPGIPGIASDTGPSPPSPFSGDSGSPEISSSSTSPSEILSRRDASGIILIV